MAIEKVANTASNESDSNYHLISWGYFAHELINN